MPTRPCRRVYDHRIRDLVCEKRDPALFAQDGQALRARVLKLEHNPAIPHSAFRGETPDEMYFGTHTGVAANLVQQRGRARQDRLATNRALTCTDCAVAVDDQPSEPSRTSYGATTGRTGSRAIPPMSQMRARRSGMS